MLSVLRTKAFGISIHAPTRGATTYVRRLTELIRFQSTLPRGERHIKAPGITQRFPISIHAPTRGATGTVLFLSPELKFQSTLPRGERPPGRRSGQAQHHAFQSTLPRGERHSRSTYCSAETIISIHAPTRGATDLSQDRLRNRSISIHAPTRGATIDQLCESARIKISIHAPTRGATFCRGLCYQCCADFNPRSHEGSDGSCPGKLVSSPRFQSTLPRGERLKVLLLSSR